MRIDIYVNKRNISLGSPNNSGACPISLAFRSKHESKVYVTETEVSYTFKDKYFSAVLPPKAREFIHAFDLGRYVKPSKFSFYFF